MTDLGEEFVLLGQELEAVSSSQLLTRVVKGAATPARIGVDSQGLKHLLLPVDGDHGMEPDSRSRGVELREWHLRQNGVDVPFIDLRCRDGALGLVFDRLAEDVLGRLAKPGVTAEAACRATLDDWRAMLQSVGAVDRATVLGLTGELEILSRVSHADPVLALKSWRGPEAAVHDFARTGSGIEVKTTSSVDGGLISISNLDQLDPTGLKTLHLAVVHVREDDSAPSLDDRVRDLAQRGMPLSDLARAVASAGYMFETAPDATPRFRVRSVRVWEVGSDFPGLTRTLLTERYLKGVSRVKYDLSLDSAPPRLADSEAENLFTGWGAQ